MGDAASTEFDGKSFRDVKRGTLDAAALGDKVKPSLESSVAEQHRQLLKRVKRVLRERCRRCGSESASKSLPPVSC